MTKKRTIKTYRELISLHTFEERYKFLRIAAKVGDPTFGSFRWINQNLYNSEEWKRARNIVIARDNGCDLGIPDRGIFDRIYVHHITPLTIEDFEENSSLIYDPENLICCSYNTHQAIHYGDESLLIKDFVERKPNDMCPWKQ